MWLTRRYIISHKTTIKTELTNKSYLKQALTKLGFTYTEAPIGQTIKTTGSYHAGIADVDIRLESHNGKNLKGSIGFKEEKDGTFSTTGDFYGMSFSEGDSITMEKLKNKVTARSKEAEINDHLLQLGFQMSDEENTAKGVQELTFERWTA